MITKQAYLNLAAVDADFAAEMEKVAGPVQWMQKGLNWMRNKFKPSSPPPASSPTFRDALKGAGRDALDYVDRNLQNVGNRVGTFLGNSVTGGQARAGYNMMRSAVNSKGALNQAQFNAGLRNLAAGGAKTGLLYGGAGYGGYRMLRGDPASEPEVARMYHRAMPY